MLIKSISSFTDYFRRKKIKLQNLDAELRANSTDKPQIFKGIVATVNGYTQPSLNDLHTLIVQHGGGFIQYLDGKTMATHVIAASLTPKKKEEFKRYRVVKPAWIVDSVKAGKVLPWDAYRVIDEGVGQRVLGFEGGKVVSTASKRTQGYREQSDASWYTSQLRASQSRNVGVRGAQTVTPDEEIEDDEFGAPEITSSIERAVDEAGRRNSVDYDGEDDEDDEYGAMVDIPDDTAIRLRTPPPTSPLCASDDPDETRQDEEFDGGSDMREVFQQAERDVHPSKGSDRIVAANVLQHRATQSEYQAPPPSAQVEAPEGTSAQALPDRAEHVDSIAAQPPPLQPREGSQEPDYTMAVIRNSEAFRSVSPSKLAAMTAEEHNALLLSDPRIRKSTVVHPEFLEQYYRESRLHHLSTWKADLKSQLQALAAEKTASQKGKIKKLPGQRRYILHVDFDSFFAAVSLKKQLPEVALLPCVVAHGGGSGSEIASCNYPARAFGISNGMWMKRAQQLCPDVKILPYDFPAYEAASRLFYDAIMATGGVVQSVSIDEALVDVSAICFAASGTDGVQRYEGAVHREQTQADSLGEALRAEVLAKTGCAVSVGIGGNILQAKVALRKAKPAGQFHLKPEDVLDFMGELEVKSLPGVAWSIGGKLEEIGIKLVRDIRDSTKERLISTLGPKTGQKMYDYARGLDKTEVGDEVVRKSVSAEVNWGVRFETQEQVDEFLHGLSGELAKRLAKERVKGKQLTMKVMKRAADAPRDPPKHLGHGKCETYNKSLQLGVATGDHETIAKDVVSLMRGFKIGPGELRGIGVQMQKLEPSKPVVAGAAGAGKDEGSQRRLHFTSGPVAKPIQREPTDDPIQDDPTTPQKPRERIANVNKPSIPVLSAAASTPTKTRLNTLGTQFVLPTQVDPSVLAELPADIRAKLARHVRPVTAAEVAPAIRKTTLATEAAVSDDLRLAAVAFPNQSQLDPSILSALPDDVRAEVLAFYNTATKDNKSPSGRKRGEQALLPQSPRTNRIIPAKASGKAPVTRRKRGGGLFAARLRGDSETPTLTQSNFVNLARPKAARTAREGSAGSESAAATTGPEDNGAPDPEFLAALPEDLRKEVLAQQRQARLQRTGGIDLSRAKARGGRRRPEDLAPLDRHVLLPPRTARPTFTNGKLSRLEDLRGAVKAWYQEFEAEGPYDEDVESLELYLTRVVEGEGDTGKAVAVVNWLKWVVDEGEEGSPGWAEAVKRVEGAVQTAVRGRGMGSVDFG